MADPGAGPSLQQQVVNAVASSQEGSYSATEFLLSTTSSPAFEEIVQWLLTAQPPFPPLSISQSSIFPLLIQGALDPAQQQQVLVDRATLLTQYELQKAEFASAAQFVGLSLLLQGIQENWESKWTDAQKMALKRSVLSVVVGPALAQAADTEGLYVGSNVNETIEFLKKQLARETAGISFKTHASRMKCAQVLNAICQREWPQRWPGVLLCLKAKASSISMAEGRQQQQARQDTSAISSSKGEGNTGITSMSSESQNDDQAFAAACILLGLIRELSQEAKEENRGQLPLRRRLQIAQGIEASVGLVLESLAEFTGGGVFNAHPHVRHLRTLSVEVIREMAGVVEVSLLLRQQNILLHLVREVRGGGYFDGCKLQVLQTFDLLCSGLAKKKSKKMAIDSVPIEDLTAFIHCIIFLAGASMADAASNHFEVDPEAFELDLSVADIVKHLCESCADQLLKRLDPTTLSLLWHMAIIPILAHPSMKIATCGAAASTALIKKFALCVTPSAHTNQERLLKAQQENLLLRQVTSPQLVEACRQSQHVALEQMREQTFPVWFDLRSYLSLLFIRCLRVGDPALLSALGIKGREDEQEGERRKEKGGVNNEQALYTKTGSFVVSASSSASSSLLGGNSISTFPKLLDDFVLTLLATTEFPAAAAREAVSMIGHNAGEETVIGRTGGGGAVSCSLLQALCTGIRLTRYAECIQNWYLRVAEFSFAEDDLVGTDALQGFAPRYAGIKSSCLMSLGICLAMSPYSASRVISELLFLSDLSLTHPLFAKRHLILPDVLLLMSMKGLPLLPEKQQPWVCPGNLVLDCVCSFIEACVQRLKSASLTFAAAISTTTSTSSVSSASSSSSLSSASKGGGASSSGETGDRVSSSIEDGGGGGGGGGGVSPLTSAAKAVEWMLPQQATIRGGGGEEDGGEIRLKKWVSDATVLFTGMLDLKLLDLEAIMTGRTVQDQQMAINYHRLLLQRGAGEGGIGIEDNNANNYLDMICLYDYLLECRRLELLSSCAYFLNYPRLKVDVILDLLFRRILADADTNTTPTNASSHDGSVAGMGSQQGLLASGTGSGGVASSSQNNFNVYPLPPEQQVYLCRRRALYTLISLCTACPGVLSQYLPMMLQHVQGRLQTHQAQLQATERSLLVESLISLIATCQMYTAQQEHTVPLVRPYVHELLLLVSQKLRGGGGEDILACCSNLLLFLFGDRRDPSKAASVTSEEEDQLTTQRRSLARVLSALESCIKRATIPTDPAALRSGGYLVDTPLGLSSSSSSASLQSSQGVMIGKQDSLLEKNPKFFGEALAELLQFSVGGAGHGVCTSSAFILPKRHPLAALMQELLPVLFELTGMYVQLSSPEIVNQWPAYAPFLMMGEEEFLSVHGRHTPLSFTPSALLESVAFTFPAPTAPSLSSSVGALPTNAASESSLGTSACDHSSTTGGGACNTTATVMGNMATPSDLSPAAQAYAKSPTRLVRRHVYHLRCFLFRLVGSCSPVSDGFYLLPKLDVYLQKVCFQPIAYLPLHQIEQQLRHLWLPILDPVNLPPQPPYPSLQLIQYFLREGVDQIVQRLNRDWEEITRCKVALESGTGGGSSASRDEERRLNIYTLHVYAADALADTLLNVAKTILHLTRAQHGGSSTTASSSVTAAASASSRTSGGAVPNSSGIDDDDIGGKGGGGGGTGDDEDAGGGRRKTDEEAAAAAHLNEMRKGIYTSTATLLTIIGAVLEAQRWPNPNTIMEAHNVLRTYVKAATKLFSPIPACTAEICAVILRGVLRSFFEKRSFDPLAFGCTKPSGAVGEGGLPSSFQRRDTGQSEQQQLTGCTRMQEFLSVAVDSTKKTYVSTYTTTAYQVLKAMCRILGDKVASADGGRGKLQPSSLLQCSYTFAAFNFFRSTEVPVRLNDEEFEQFVSSIMLKDSKEGKAFVMVFFQRNWEVLQRADGRTPAVQFKIADLPPEQQASLTKLQSSATCDLGNTFLSSFF
ncbi:exportin 1-like protein [Cystoisospora suis]|uniref:Exportin 1-like protein n=1 Tax=Cystoisospora suis TaxID=483139 RepID=A0A2C6KYV2_9APIC|nr:exportin 1-like protein [Cystoisospora suis]